MSECLCARLVRWLFVCLCACLIVRFCVRLVSRCGFDCVVGRLVSCLLVCLYGCFIVWLLGWDVDCSFARLFVRLLVGLFDVLVACLCVLVCPFDVLFACSVD